MATYQGERFIAEQLDSIFAQDHPKINLYIYDDGSTDKTVEIIKKYQAQHPQIIFLPAERNQGTKYSFSYLLGQSKSPYVMFCDQDDIWLKNKVSLTYSKMKELERKNGHHIPIAVHTDLEVVDKQLNLINRSFWKYSHLTPSYNHTLNRLLVQNVMTGCTMMINKTLKELAYPIPTNAVMHDWWVALIASALGCIGHISDRTVLYRQHSSNALGAKRFYSFNSVRNVLNRLHQNDDAKLYHAHELLVRYKNLLTIPQIEMLEDFIQLHHTSWSKRRYLIFKNGFFKNGFLRNSVMLLLQ
jgi:glycosyltransferase involved in cell wall biosynthesis